MNIDYLKDKLVAVLGFGQEGRAVAEYLTKHGIQPVLFDSKPWEEWPEQEREYIKSLDLNFIFGPDYLNELKGFDVAFRSPGIPLTKIKDEKINLTSQTKWFFEHCPAPIIGVTGTKGKGTTATLISLMITRQNEAENSGRRVFLTGNIGKIQPLSFLDGLKPEDAVVYELSSFQLQDLKQSPGIGVVLMVTQDHLDHHKNTGEYHEAKQPITAFQTKNDYAVINADNETSRRIGELGQGQKLYFSRTRTEEVDCFVKDGVIYLSSEPVIKTAELRLRGPHNWENVCASILAARCAGCELSSIVQVLKEFKGLEHRLEMVAEKNGVKYYNDSFSTTPDPAIAAIHSFEEPKVLILGGSSKGADFTELGKAVSENGSVRAVVLIGEEAGKIKQSILAAGGNTEFLEGAADMEETVRQAAQAAKPGDVVILSPACASFGMFKNYKDRGEKFREEVGRLGY